MLEFELETEWTVTTCLADMEDPCRRQQPGRDLSFIIRYASILPAVEGRILSLPPDPHL